MQMQPEEPTKELKKHSVLGPVATIFTAANTGSWRLERPKVDYNACVKCGICAMYCPADVIIIDNNAKECVSFDFNYCKGCGICANECSRKCITMVPEGGENR